MDRNFFGRRNRKHILMSLSARRAWIEIAKSTPEDAKRWVALRKESVDRNINQEKNPGKTVFVALRKESVDRNIDT